MIIDGKNIKVWQSIIGYVPQNIYLSDDSIIANIAFGVSSEDIDYDSVERVAKIANLHEFIINKLPKKYQTKIGERGVDYRVVNVKELELPELCTEILDC